MKLWEAGTPHCYWGEHEMGHAQEVGGGFRSESQVPLHVGAGATLLPSHLYAVT